MFKYILESLTNRGFMKTVERGISIIKRYGITKGRILRNLELLVNILDDYDAKATLPITTATFLRNSEILDVLDTKRVELAIHGYEHIDYTKLPYETILTRLREAIKIFKENKVDVHGFRAPYLKVNDNVIRAIGDSGLKYDSSYPLYFDVLPSNLKNSENVKKLLNQYDFKYDKPYRYRLENGVIEIPVALPDDEILVDRLSLTPKEVAKYWVKILDKITTNYGGGIFVLQLHPERLNILEYSLKKTLEEAINREFILVNLKEIATTKDFENENYLAITGDIDILDILDLMNIRGAIYGNKNQSKS